MESEFSKEKVKGQGQKISTAVVRHIYLRARDQAPVAQTPLLVLIYCQRLRRSATGRLSLGHNEQGDLPY